MVWAFWTSVFLVAYSYVLYPLLLRLLAFRKRGNHNFFSRDEFPTVSVIIAAYNEQRVIAEKIDSVLSCHYPDGKLEILIGSDASHDDTVPIVKQYAARYPFISCFDFTERRGKPSVVNDLVQAAKGEILVLTDANVIFSLDTLKELVKHFKEPDIGLVDTNMVNRGLKTTGISFQEKAYISREVKIKHREGLIWGAMMGPFGGCYAIRKSDFTPIPPHSLVDDFYINMKILEKGKKAINELKAVVYEDVSDNLSHEFRRKTRIATGNFQNLRRFAHMLWPPWNAKAFTFMSHKVLRWFGPIFIITAVISNLFIMHLHPVYLASLATQVFLMGLVPIIDLIFRRINIYIPAFRLAVHFYSMNLALFAGLFRYLRGVSSGVWKPTPRPG